MYACGFYSHVAAIFEQFSVEGLCELLHLVGKSQVINPVLHTAKCRFRGHAVPQHAHFAEFVEIVSAELHYRAASDMSGEPAEYHQYDNVGKTMTDIPFV